MRTTLQSISILVFLLFSVQAEAFQETDWYWIYHGSGCVPLSELYREFPYFAGARTPRDILEKVRTATSGENIRSGFSPILPIREELKPVTEIVAKIPRVYQIYKDPRMTRENAIALVVREEPQDFMLFFFHGDLCNALFGSGP
jgi:hypothetical protein